MVRGSSNPRRLLLWRMRTRDLTSIQPLLDLVLLFSELEEGQQHPSARNLLQPTEQSPAAELPIWTAVKLTLNYNRHGSYQQNRLARQKYQHEQDPRTRLLPRSRCTCCRNTGPLGGSGCCHACGGFSIAGFCSWKECSQKSARETIITAFRFYYCKKRSPRTAECANCNSL